MGQWLSLLLQVVSLEPIGESNGTRRCEMGLHGSLFSEIPAYSHLQEGTLTREQVGIDTARVLAYSPPRPRIS